MFFFFYLKENNLQVVLTKYLHKNDSHVQGSNLDQSGVKVSLCVRQTWALLKVYVMLAFGHLMTQSAVVCLGGFYNTYCFIYTYIYCKLVTVPG